MSGCIETGRATQTHSNSQLANKKIIKMFSPIIFIILTGLQKYAWPKGSASVNS